ncbi:uncharacterized protein BDV14DRAFT_165678 [Aspergillus stella-maris]|uniref:uncharacterized protein n=1 Tax=Aspergillus stella-maris TaxID=1810926 RepID=UPI003CCDF98D
MNCVQKSKHQVVDLLQILVLFWGTCVGTASARIASLIYFLEAPDMPRACLLNP